MRPNAYLGDHTSLITTTLHHRMYVDTLDTIAAPHLIVDGFWESWVTKFIQETFTKGSVFVDVGAHLGWYTLVAHHAGARLVHSFEPNPRLNNLLLRTLSINGLSGRTNLHEIALLDGDHEAEFEMPVNWSANGRVIRVDGAVELGEPGRATERMKIRTRSLDDMNVGPVDFIKIDAEGSESRIIRGATALLQANPQARLLVEHHCLDAEYETMTWLQEQFGFTLAYVDHGGRAAPLTVADLPALGDSEMLYLARP